MIAAPCWSILRTPPLAGAVNMALDEALMARARERGCCVLRTYEWSRPTLSLGRNQRAAGTYDLARARAAGVDFVRRPTGGRAVLHHREVTYSVTAPASALGELRESYAAINVILVAALHALGVAATVAEPEGRAPPPGSAPCFEEPVAGEIVAAGRKLVGSAQWRERGALLQHGSILVDDDQVLASELLLRPAPPPPPPATLRALLGRAPSADDVAEALRSALSEGGAEVGTLEMDDDLRSAALIARATYEDDRWTWRQ